MAKPRAYFIDHSLERCSLAGCDRIVVASVGGRKVCNFHFALLTASHSEVQFNRERDEAQRGDPNFGLNMEEENELETPGDPASKQGGS